VKRRDFITLVGGSAAAWPLAARAQQREQMRRIGALIGFTETDPDVQSWLAAFRAALAKLGWTEGSNLRIELRWAGDPDRIKTFAKELVDLRPDAILIAAAARYRVPAIYYFRSFADSGGLISYGPDFAPQYPQAAEYVDRILKGEKPGDLPIQMPVQVPLLINLKAANALGLDVPLRLLNAADEVIE
jgi:ABC-type uncharacterized transport system substrate-binding protein